jgi:N-acetylmuramoyl-L-alanine amidase
VIRRLVPITLLAAASILLAQSPNQATLRTAAGDRAITVILQGGQTLFAADEVVLLLGGTMVHDANGFRATVNNTVAAFGPDSRFGVVKGDLIEMPVEPVVIDNRAYVPWQFFQGFLSKAGDQEVSWDPLTHVLSIRPAQHAVVAVQVSVANIQGTSKVVLTMSAPSDYAIVKEAAAYVIRFKSTLRAPFPEQTYDDPYVAKASFSGSDLRITLKAPDVVGDAYRLENPFRIVVDFRKGSGTATGIPRPPIGTHPIEMPGIHTIVIDPGHGGKDVGATGTGGLMEKDATLALCRKLADSLESRLRARVVLTRTDDTVVPLDQRTAIANQYKADLFLSVHLNAAVVKGAHGSETYFLSLDASDELARKAAEVENADARTETTSTDLKLILWDLAQQEYLNESSRFAQVVQEEMNRATGVQSRGVKQAPFKVLVGATMPAALVEVAFISNPDEEAKLRSEDFQSLVVNALTTAVERYKVDYETRIGIVHPALVAPATLAPTVQVKKAGT